MISGMMEGFSAVDFGIIGVLAISVITGMMRGSVREIIALFAWIIGVFLAITYAHDYASWFVPYLHDLKLCEGAAFLAILVGTLIASSILNFILSFFLKSSGLIIIDKVLGIGFGFIRGILIVSLIMVVIKLMDVNVGQKDSQLYQRFSPVVNWINQFVQPYVQKVGATYEEGMGKVKTEGASMPAVPAL